MCHPSEESVQERIKKTVIKILDIPAGDYSPEITFEDYGADSLDVAELCLAVEEEFDITIPYDVVDKILTARDYFSVVQERV